MTCLHFMPPRLLAMSNGRATNFIVQGDFNNDGNLDLIVTSINNEIIYLVGDGDGLFNELNAPIQLGFTISGMVAARFRVNEANIDLAVIGENNRIVRFCCVRKHHRHSRGLGGDHEGTEVGPKAFDIGFGELLLFRLIHYSRHFVADLLASRQTLDLPHSLR